jgi:tight adherence protein B
VSAAAALLLVLAIVLALASLAGVERSALGASGWSEHAPHVRLRRRRAAAAAVAGLPDALRRLAAELSAGRTVEHALASAGSLAEGPLGPALRGAAEDLARGRPLDEALGRRLPPDPACELLAAGLALQRRVGGDLPRLCRELARTLDERCRVEADVRALTAQARFSAIAVPLLPPLGLLAMTVLDPVGVHRLVATPLGLMIVLSAAMLDVVGALLIRGVVRSIA